MIGERPDFIDSPYFVMEIGNWHLKDGAPEEVVEEFNRFMSMMSLLNTGGNQNGTEQTE